MGFFPLYRESLLTGPSHVSFSLPGIPSGISKSIGLTSSALLLVPNIDFLQKFIEGDLGISDSTWKASIFKNINSLVSSSQESVFRKFGEINDLKLGLVQDASKIGSDLIKQGTSMASNLTGQATSLGSNLVNQGSGILNTVTGQVTSIGGNLVNQGSGVLSNLTGQASSFSGNLVSQGSGILSNLTGQASSFGGNFTQNMFTGSNLNNLTGNITSNLTSQGTNILGNLTSQGTNILSNVTGQGSNIVGNLTGGTNILSNVTGGSNILSNVTGGSNILSNLTGQGSNILSNVTGQGSNILSNVTGQATNIGTNLLGQGTTIASNFTGQVSGIASNFTGQATSQFSNLKGKGIGIVNDITGQASSIGNKLVGQGSGMLNSLTNNPGLSKYKKDGKFKLPLSEIKISSAFDGAGLKAFEKATLQSIFETQKPYMEIAKTVLSLLVDIEDIVARVMPLASANPLKHKSEKPTVNSGANGAKAVGYQSGKDIKVILAQLDKVTKQGGKITVNKDGSVTKETKNKNVNDNESELDPDTISANDKLVELSKTYKIINVVYSTNYYDPKIDYLYSYIDLPADPEAPVNATSEDDDTDPYNKYKPKRIVFGIFNSKGVPVNPDDILKTIGYSGNQIIQVPTTYKKAEWIKKSSKWRFRGNEYIWPTFGTPNFVFNNGIIDKVAKTTPDSGDLAPAYSLKKYKEGDKNILNKEDANPGDPVIDGFDSTDTSIYTKYFTEYTTINLRLAKDLEEKDRIDATQTIMSQLNVNSHLENVFNYGQNKSSIYKGINGNPAFPEIMKLSFKPYQIFVSEAQADEKLAGLNGLIWIDPESDYDMKVVRIDPVTKIKSDNAKSEPNLSTTIKSFIKNKYTIKLSNNSKFNIDINRNGLKYDSQKDVTTYTLENWNYENSKIENTNIFSYTVYNDTISLTGDLSIDNLPVIGKEKIVNIDISNNIGLESNIPLYQLRVTDLNNPYGSIIDPSKITNENLSKDELFSKGKYGVGDSDNPQEVEILERYQITDLDTESYYIIEGIRVDQNIQDGDNTPGGGKNGSANGDSGSKWYRLPHAVGAVTVFIKMLIKVFAKLIPSITKLLKLFSNPMSFITDIIAEKLGESFTFLSKSAFKKYSSVAELAKKRDEILKNQGGATYVNLVKEQFKNSPLKNYMFINNFGTKATNMPGIKNITDKVTSIGGSLTSNLGNLKNVGSNIVGNLSGQASSITTFGSNIANNLSSQTSSILSNVTGQATAIGTNLVGQGSNILNNVTGQATAIGGNLASQGTNIFNNVTGQATTIGSNIVGQGTNIFNNLTGQATTIGGNLFSQGSNIASNLTGQAATIGGNLFSQGSNISSNLTGQAATIGGNLFSQGSNIANNLTGQAATIGGNLFSQGSNIANNLTGQAATIGGNLFSQGTNIANNLTGQATAIGGNLFSQGSNIANNLTGQATAIGGNLFSQGTNIANNLTGQATTIGGNLFNKGTNIVNNLTSQTSTISNGLSNKAKSFTNNLNKNKLIPPILKEVQGMGDFKNILDGVGFIPFSIFGKDLSFGMELKFGNLLAMKAPLKLLFNSSKKSKDEGSKDKTNKITSEDKTNSQLTDPNQFDKGNVGGGTQVNTNTTGKNTNTENVYQIVSTWYSTGEFINGVDYNYIYITLDNEQLLNEVEELESSDNPDDVLLAKEKLEEAIKKNPNDESLKNKLKDIKAKLFDLASNAQPILKLILSLVTLPIKVIADVVKYIMDFFKSLTNPLALPGKIAEFLSFKWIMDFFTPKGILEILGLKFKPELIAQWVGMATAAGAKANNIKNNIVEKGSNIVSQASDKFNSLKTQTSDITTKIVGQGTNILNNVTGQASAIGNNLVGQGTNIASNLSSQFGNLTGQGSNIVSNLTGQATTIGGNLFNQGSNIANNLTGQAATIGGNLFSQGTNIANNLTGQATAIGGNLFSQGSNIANNLTGQATTIGGNLFSQGSNIASNLTGQATTIGGNLFSQGSNIASNLTGQATTIGGNLFSQGTNIANNLTGQATAIGGNLMSQGTKVAKDLTGQATKIGGNLMNQGTDMANNLTSKASQVKGFLYGDDFELADLSKFFSAPFIPTLPTYTASHFRDMIKNKSMFPFKLFLPSICLIESVVNGFIDFIWSTLGLEIIIKPPHIKLCSSTKSETMNALDIQKTLNGELPTSSNIDNNTTEVTSTIPFESQVLSDNFIYEVKLPDGTIKTILDKEELDNFMQENKDINFDIQF